MGAEREREPHRDGGHLVTLNDRDEREEDARGEQVVRDRAEEKGLRARRPARDRRGQDRADRTRERGLPRGEVSNKKTQHQRQVSDDTPLHPAAGREVRDGDELREAHRDDGEGRERAGDAEGEALAGERSQAPAERAKEPREADHAEHERRGPGVWSAQARDCRDEGEDRGDDREDRLRDRDEARGDGRRGEADDHHAEREQGVAREAELRAQDELVPEGAREKEQPREREVSGHRRDALAPDRLCLRHRPEETREHEDPQHRRDEADDRDPSNERIRRTSERGGLRGGLASVVSFASVARAFRNGRQAVEGGFGDGLDFRHGPLALYPKKRFVSSAKPVPDRCVARA